MTAPSAAAERIELLIVEAKGWSEAHARAGQQIEVAACAIRLKALRDCLKIVGGGKG